MFAYQLIVFSDIFGKRVSLTLNNNETSKTFIGGILSIAFIIGVIVPTLCNICDIINRHNPIVAGETVFYKLRPEIILNSTSMPLAISFSDVTNNHLDLPRYLKYEASSHHYFVNESGSFNEDHIFDLKKCNKSNFPLHSEEWFNSTGFKTNLCVSDQNISVFGYWGDKEMTYFSFIVSICKNNTDASNCAPIEEIKEFLKQSTYYWNIYYQDSFVNSMNYQNPIARAINARYRTVEPGRYKYLELFFNKQTLFSDEGFFGQNIFPLSTLTLDNFDSDGTLCSDDNQLLDITIYSSNKEVFFYRRYEKWEDMMSQLGGIKEALGLIIYFFVYGFSQISMNLSILNQIFHFELDQNNNSSVNSDQFSHNQNFISGNINPVPLYKKLNIKSELGLNNFTSVNADKRDKSTVFRLSAYHPQSFSVLNNTFNKPGKLDLSFWEIVGYYSCIRLCMSKKVKSKFHLYLKKKDIINNYLDLTFYIKKFDEFDKFKYIFLNKGQKAMFSFSRKEVCKLNEFPSKKTIGKELRKNPNHLGEIVVSYLNALKEAPQDISKIDKKLFKKMPDAAKKVLLDMNIQII